MGPQTGCQFFKEYTIGEYSLQIYTTKILDSIFMLYAVNCVKTTIVLCPVTIVTKLYHSGLIFY